MKSESHTEPVLDVVLTIDQEDKDRIEALLSGRDLLISTVEKKGLDGSGGSAIFVISGTVAVLRSLFKFLEEKFKSQRSSEVTIGGVTVKGISERAVIEVLDRIRPNANGN